MTIIAGHLRWRDGGFGGFGSVRGWVEPTCPKDGFDVRDYLLEQSGFAEHVTTGDSHLPFGRPVAPRLLGDPGRDGEGSGHDGLELVHICHVINEALWFPSMQETDGRRVARRENRRFAKAVETSGGGG
jgi:hypothetical protein